MSTHLSNMYSQKLLDSTKKYATDALKTASKRAIQKTAEAASDLIGNKIADKITKYFKKTLQINCIQRKRNYIQMKLIMKYQKKYIYFQKKDNKSLMN